ncbi:hypothetical protein [Halorarum salinum]|uniref:Uncharacterized protein n=1 Tax=Halorarum salinum TaxID=2743089 RepID=A0A7D5QK77_9EURY|nr:hypothetical protein [Halobaculum salinum]QLG61965.1 hypothetical protein HUG12_09630 [Halobaculum salinum]
MSANLSYVEDARSERFGQVIADLRKESVDDESYADFVSRVDSITAQVDEIIESEQEDRQKLLQEREQILEREGEEELVRLREDGLAPAELERVESELREVTRKIEDWFAYRSDLQKVKAGKVKAVLDEMDTLDIQARVYEELDDRVKDRVDEVETDMDDLETDLRTQFTEFKAEMKQERRDYREGLREERRRDWDLISEVLQKAIQALDRVGLSPSGMQQRVADHSDRELPLEAPAEGLSTGEAEADPAVLGDDADEGDAADADAESKYRFKDRPSEERLAEFKRLVSEEPVQELTKQEIVELTDLSWGGLYDKERGTLVRVEQEFDIEFPELH